MRTYTFQIKDKDNNYITVEITATDLRAALRQLRSDYPDYLYNRRV